MPKPNNGREKGKNNSEIWVARSLPLPLAKTKIHKGGKKPVPSILRNGRERWGNSEHPKSYRAWVMSSSTRRLHIGI